MTYAVNIVSIDSTESVGGNDHARGLGIRGIRAARNHLGDRLGAHVSRATLAFDQALTTLPYRIGGHDDQKRALEAARAAETASGGVLGCEVTFEAGEALEAAGAAGTTEGILVYQVEVCDSCGHEVTLSNTECQHNGPTTFKDAVLIEDVPEPMPFEWDAIACAMTTLVAASGNLALPSLANTYARTYGRHVAPDFWSDVEDVLTTVFPMVDE